MDIWVFSNEYDTKIIGGLGIVATKLTNGFTARGSNVTLIGSCDDSRVASESRGSLRTIRFPYDVRYYSHQKQKSRYRAIASWLQRSDVKIPDVIHIHSVNFTNLATHYKRNYGTPIVYTCHSLVILEKVSRHRHRVSLTQKKLLNLADIIVAPSQWQKETIEKTYSFTKGKVIVIENGVDTKSSATIIPPERLLFVGRLTKEKGIEELLEAVAKLSKKNPKVRLDVAGKGMPAYFAKLKRMSKKLGIAKKVRWRGFVKPQYIHDLYKDSGAVIVPSKQESFCLVALEALGNGVPLVSTLSGGLSQLVSEHVATLIPRVRGSAIAGAIDTMWRHEAETKQRVENGMVLASEYQWNKVIDRYLDLFHTILNEKKQELSTYDWLFKNAWKAKRQGHVWSVEHQTGQRGYFKFAKKNQWFYAGTMVANEWIAAALAKRLDLPTAELQLTTVKGPNREKQEGIVSVSVNANEVLTWQDVGRDVKKNPELHVENIDLLSQMVVFDAWIANIDRGSGKNLILYRNDPSEKYKWYMIDHGHTLYGSPNKWVQGAYNAPRWQKLWQVYHVPKGLLRLQSRMEILEPMIAKIQGISEEEIDRIIQSVPSGYLPDRERRITKKILLHRQKNLRAMLTKWIKSKMTKEYRY